MTARVKMRDTEVYDAYQKGVRARLNNQPKQSNPYPAGTLCHQAWALGYADADKTTNN